MKTNCRQCDKEFDVRPCVVRDGNGKYCSRDCMGKARSRLFIGENNPAWRGGPVICTCFVCGKQFERKRSDIKDGQNQYCSYVCMGEGRKGNRGDLAPAWKGGKIQLVCETCGKHYKLYPSQATPTRRYCSVKCKGKAARGITYIDRVCAYCGKSFQLKESDAKRGRGQYCSQTCFRKSDSFNLPVDVRGKNNPNWRGGVTPIYASIRTSKNYNEWRNAVYARDNWTCQECGDNKGGNLHAHHVFSFAQFPEHRFATWNGLTLCATCHQKCHPDSGLSHIRSNRIGKPPVPSSRLPHANPGRLL